MHFPVSPPVLTTPRLRLRAFTLSDALAVQTLAAHADVATTTQAIPHPYPAGAAGEWISTHSNRWATHEELILAYTLKSTNELIGSISLRFEPAWDRGELGYWAGAPYWNRGYTTEATQALIAYGFRTLHLNRIQAHHMANNPASGRVMEKAGLTREGRSPQAIKKNGHYHDLIFYGLVREDWDQASEPL